MSEQAQGLGSVRQAKIWKKSTRERKQQVWGPWDRRAQACQRNGTGQSGYTVVGMGLSSWCQKHGIHSEGRLTTRVPNTGRPVHFTAHIEKAPHSVVSIWLWEIRSEILNTKEVRVGILKGEEVWNSILKRRQVYSQRICGKITVLRFVIINVKSAQLCNFSSHI